MPGELDFSMRDNNGELGNISIHTDDITAVSLPGTLTQVGSMRAAIEGITLGVTAKERLSVFDTKLSAANAVSKLASRGVKWTVSYRDITQWFDPINSAYPNPGFQKVYTCTIPTADLTLKAADSDEIDYTLGLVSTFIAEFEALARSPSHGNVEVLSIRHID